MNTMSPRHSVSVSGVIPHDHGRVLLVRRRDNQHWKPPGGVLELAETIHDGLRREVPRKPDSISSLACSPASTRICPATSLPSLPLQDYRWPSHHQRRSNRLRLGRRKRHPPAHQRGLRRSSPRRLPRRQRAGDPSARRNRATRVAL
jgi:NUDIX domain-containing protein